jgi:hypothetical protein
MSRSIHDTRRFLFEALHDDFADPELQSELVRTARQNLQRQRAIKDHARAQRRRLDVPIPPLDPERVPILVSDEAPGSPRPVTEEDLRAVMRRLPPGSLDGLAAIELCLGGAGAGAVQGAYAGTSQAIRLTVGRMAPGAPAVLAIVLKLSALVAFVRQAAHHFDHAFRVQGPR